MKKVVIITNKPAPYRVALFNYLSKTYKNYEFHIIYSVKQTKYRKWNVPDSDAESVNFLKSLIIPFKRKYDTYELVIPFGVGKTLRKLSPDVIVASEYNLAVQAAFRWAKRHKVPYISWSDATAVSERNIKPLKIKIRRKIVAGSTALIASSSKTKELQISYGADAKNIFVSLLTVDTEKYLVKKNDYPQKIIYVGYIFERKGIDLLFNSLALLHNDFALEIYGAGELTPELSQLAKKLGIYNKIHVNGFLQADKLKEKYAEAGLFVLPTREDCFGLVILEAMCASLPVVVSKYADGSYDLVKDGENGFITDPYDAKKTAEKIDLLLSDEKIRREMGLRSYSLSMNFGIDKSAVGFVEAIDFALSKTEGINEK